VDTKHPVSFRQEFHFDYPVASCYLFYGGEREYRQGPVSILAVAGALPRLSELL
jgi:hypothetical protein